MREPCADSSDAALHLQQADVERGGALTPQQYAMLLLDHRRRPARSVTALWVQLRRGATQRGADAVARSSL